MVREVDGNGNLEELGMIPKTTSFYNRNSPTFLSEFLDQFALTDVS